MNLFETLGLIGAAFGVGLAYGFSGGAILPVSAGALVGLPVGWLVFARFRKAALTSKITDEQTRLKMLYWLMPISVGALVMLSTWLSAEVVKRVAA